MVETIVKNMWIETQCNQEKKTSITIQTIQCHQLKDAGDEWELVYNKR